MQVSTWPGGRVHTRLIPVSSTAVTVKPVGGVGDLRAAR